MTEKGMTLVEVLIALIVGSLIMLGVYTTVNMGQLTSTGMERRVIAQQDVRAALDLMALEIRMASFNRDPTNNTLWVSCTGNPPVPQFKGIQDAAPNSITIQMDIDENGAIGSPNEIITYVYDAQNMRITRATQCGGAQQPFLGDTAAAAALGRPRVVRIVNDLNGNNSYDAGVDIPLFRYFDQNNAEITAAQLNNTWGTTPNKWNIRVIEITLVAETEHVDPASKERKRLVYSTRVAIRNHGINP